MRPEQDPPRDPETQRLQALRSYAVLDSAAEAGFDEITALAARHFEMPVALVSLVDHDRQWFKSRVGLDVDSTPRELAFCDHAIRGPGVLVLPDAAADPAFADNPLVTGAPGLRFYAGAPLITPDGHAVGTLCVMDRRPREFDAAQCATLAALSRQVMAQLELRKTNAELAAALAALRSEHEALAQVRERLEASELRTELVLRGSDDGWWDWNLVTGEVYYSPRGWAMLGYADQALPYGPALWSQLIHADDLPTLMRTITDGLRGRAEHCTMEMRMRHRAGHDVPILARGYILRNERGRALRFSGSNTDLSGVKRAERERAAIQDNYEALFRSSFDGVLQVRPEGPVLAANPAACAMLGRNEDELRAMPTTALLDRSDPRLPGMLAERQRTGHTRGELRGIRADGTLFDIELSSSLFRDRHGELMASVVFRDITERRSWARRLEESLTLLHNLSQRVPGVLYQFRLYPDGRSCFPFAGANLWAMYEVMPEEVKHDASRVFTRLHVDDLQAVGDAIRASAATLQTWRQEYRVVLPEQGLKWRQGEAQPELLGDGSVLWHGFINDITERKEAEARTHRLAHYDALTGLPNRRLLTERIEQALSSARRSGQWGALLFADLDNFKHINDARGHAVGDSLLQQAALRVAAGLRQEDLVARLGGDEFVVLVGQLGEDLDAAARHAGAVAEKLRQALEEPYEIDGLHYSSSGSLGITLFPKRDESVDDLLREADTAMYRAKDAGRNRVAYFEAAMQSEVAERLALQQDLKRALAAGALTVALQAQFDAAGREVGGELLLRWQHPQRGAVSPAQFIPVAEESGLIVPMGEFVIRQACETLVRLRSVGAMLPLSVNVSPRQFHKDDFVDRVRSLLHETGAPATGLIFEVTEGVFIDNWQATQARMAALVALGIRFSIDDFGTGYSSLSYLKKLPLWELKIDRSFVRDVPDDPSDTGIVQSILSVASHLGLRVVAEGVETRAQAEFLVDNGCDCLQGFLLARPVALADWTAQRMAGAAGAVGTPALQGGG